MKIRRWFGTAALVTLFGCSGEPAAPGPGSGPGGVAQSNLSRVPASAVSATDLHNAVLSNNSFAVDLYAQALKSDPTKNVLTSPISAMLALTMAYAGALGTTKSEMASALHFDALADDAVFAGQNALSQALNGRAAAALARATETASQGNQPAPQPADYQLDVVNSVWGERSYTWETPFLDTLAANYGTGVREQDFVHAFEPARLAINAWVSERTNDKINDLLSKGDLDEQTRMVLVNAIHVKLPWATAFDANATSVANFERSGQSSVSTSFMHRTAELLYSDDSKAQIVSLPLSNGELSVLIALPHPGLSLADYEATLTAGSLSTPTAGVRVALSLPKAKFTSPSVRLAEALKALGMRQAFDQDLADFHGLCKAPPDGSNLYISDVLQKAMIAMQETGVEAAAATAVVVAGTTSAPIDPPAEPVAMDVNRPYLLAILDNPSGAVLMLGHIQDPTDAGSP